MLFVSVCAGGGHLILLLKFSLGVDDDPESETPRRVTHRLSSKTFVLTIVFGGGI